MGGDARRRELSELAEPLCAALESAHLAREQALSACRRTIRISSLAIRAVHRGEAERVRDLTAEARDALRRAQQALLPHPQVAHAGFLHDAEKEYAEAVFTAALLDGRALPSREEVGVGVAAWLCGLAEAASELRRSLLDRIREGNLAGGEQLLATMDDIYEVLVSIDYPDALTGGLRRTTDSLRAVLERSRADVTTTVMQSRLQAAIERRLSQEGA